LSIETLWSPRRSLGAALDVGQLVGHGSIDTTVLSALRERF